MNKKEILKTLNDIDWAEFGYSKSVQLEHLTEEAQQRMIEEWGEEAEYTNYLLGLDIEDEDVEDWDGLHVEWYDTNFYSEMEYWMEEIFKNKYQYFISYSERGFNPPLTLDETIEGGNFPDYDCSLFLKNVSRNRKTVRFLCCHHDCPTGQTRYLSGLTEQQYEFINECLYEHRINDVREFLESLYI